MLGARIAALTRLAWLTAESPQGTRRLFEPGDYVRLELATILRRDIRAVRVLVGGARMPKAAELPDDLQGLAQRQAVELHDETWRDDVDGLIRSLRGEPAGARQPTSPLARCRNNANRAAWARRGVVVAVGARHRPEHQAGD